MLHLDYPEKLHPSSHIAHNSRLALQKSHLEHQFTYPGTEGPGRNMSFSARIPVEFSSDYGMDTSGSSTPPTKAVGLVYSSGWLTDLEKQSGSELEVKDSVTRVS